MRHSRRATALAAAALLASPVVAHAATTTTPVPAPLAAPALQPWLQDHLTEVAPTTALRVMVRGTSETAAAEAVQAAGMRVQQSWPLLDVAVAVGPAAAVPGLLAQDGVVYVEGDTPLDYHLETAHDATRSTEAAATFPGVDGTGVSIAVIDSGIDGTHPFFQQDGTTKVVQNRKNACGIDVEIDPTLSETCFVSAPDTDTISGGGHGTHVAGIAAGVPVTAEGRDLRGSASGAKLVGLSVGAAIGLLDAVAAQNWVLEHQKNPCVSAAEQATAPVDPACPPIRVTNHSYGPLAEAGQDQVFDESSAAVVAQRKFVEMGGVAVWAAGNDGGDGSYAATNPDAMDPTPGVLMVASYNDAGTGTRDNELSTFSSRGKAGADGTYPDVSAPGDLITSSCRAYLTVCATGGDFVDGGNYNTISGTSMASPYVAGVVAQLMQANPALTPAQIEDALEDTAYKFAAGAPYVSDSRNADDTSSFDKGHGLVDVVEALAVATGTTAAPAPAPAAPPAPRCGDGTNLVTDASGDASGPVPGAPAAAQDITALSFAATDGTLAATARFVDLSDVPAPGTTFTTYLVTWTGPDGVQYGVEHSAPGGDFTVGQFDATNNSLVTGTTTPVTGTKVAGPGGTITWSVPLGLVGSPAIPAATESAAAVRDSYGLTIAGEGAMGSGLVFTAPVDRAPDSGKTASWSVCAPVVEPIDEPTEPPAPPACTRPNGKPCRTAKG